MRKVLIKYNPYKVETEITIDGKPVKKNSALNVEDRRFQEWVEELPDILVEECNEKEFEIVFHGTMLDYEDLISVVGDAKGKGIVIHCTHIPAKEVKDKEQAIAQLFADIQAGPFDELRQPDVTRAFQNANSSEFPVNVVATMSAGKSTLINALLRQKLMPAKQEACTATITEIKDMDLPAFRATVYDSNGNLIETQPELTLPIMDKLNSNPAVSSIIAEGDIPFVTSDDVSLVLVDTPGPNNSRDPEHRAATYRMLSESSKTVVLYIMNATQLAVNDDNNLLSHVADSMKVGGKQSKDRFVFVVNKLDDFKKGEDSVTSAIEKVRQYLEDKGIHNPNIYPASALSALDIRTTLRDVDMTTLDMNTVEDPEMFTVISKVKKLNRTPDLHLEAYAPLTPSVRGEITAELSDAQAGHDEKAEALIHTGIIPIEAAIRMYVRKYAKTAKIKNIVDTFAKKLESARSFETTKQEIASNRDKQKEIASQIEAVKRQLTNGQEAKKFKSKVQAINFDSEINAIAAEVIGKAQAKVTEQIDSNRDAKLSKRDAESICAVFAKFAESISAEVQVKLEQAVTAHVEKSAQALVEQYVQKLSDLAKDIKTGTVSVNPFELMSGDVGSLINISSVVSSATKTERVKTGEHYVTNTSKKWYKPWTWFQEKGHYVADYGDREYIDSTELATKFFAPVQKTLYENRDSAIKYAKEQAADIKAKFSQKFDELDGVLARKLNELELCAADNESVEKTIQATTARLSWLESIQTRINSILDI